MKYQLIVTFAVTISVVLTLLSGYFITLYTPAGVIIHGYPFYWITQGSIGPNSDLGKYGISWDGLIFDLLLWSIVPFVILWAYSKLKKK